MNNSFNNRLIQFVLTLFAIFYWLGVHADGSKDLYPSGASGYRAFLRAYTTPTNNWPFANQGVHYVYARPGETITLASSAQDQNSGRIGTAVGRSYVEIQNSLKENCDSLVKATSSRKWGKAYNLKQTMLIRQKYRLSGNECS